MRTQTFLIALQFLLPLCIGLNVMAADQPEKQTVVYKKAGTLEIKADVYHYADTKVRPAVVSLHGGALIMGHRENLSNALKDFASTNGYVLVSFDYRLAPETKLPAIIEDIEDAFRWFRREGPKRFHLDPGRIAVTGGSAAGYLALATGYRVQPRPRVLLAFFGYGDLIGDWYATPSPHPRHNQRKISADEAWQQVSGPADLLPGFVGADLSLIVPRMRAWSRIPIADQISIPKEGQEHSRSGLDPVAGSQRKIPSRRTAGHRDTLRVEVKSFRTLAAKPAERVLDILDDRRQFRLGRQAVVERDQD